MRLPKNSAPCASSGLRLRSRDLAKLGHLVLRRGEWNGQRIISARWIDQCLTPQIGGPEIYFYGFQWMLGRSLVRQREISWAVATGLGGQRLFVIPALDLIVAITAGLYTGPLQYSLPLQILNRHVLDAIRDKRARPVFGAAWRLGASGRDRIISGQISVRSRSRACRCRPRSEPAAADRPLVETSALLQFAHPAVHQT